MILSKRPDIDRFLKAPQGARAALIYGRDRGVAAERASEIAGRIAKSPDDPFDVAVLADGEAEAGRLEEELSAISMIGGRRLVRLRLSGERDAIDKLAAQALGRHVAGEFNPDAFFLIEAGALGRESALRGTGEKAPLCAVIPCYEDEPGDIARMARESLAADRVSLSPEAMDLFVSRLPHERGVARQEIERLILFAGPGSGRQVSAAELENFLGVEPEASLSQAASDAFGGRAAPAQAGLRRAAAEGESGPAAVRALGAHLARLRRVLLLNQAGAELAEAAKASGVFWKQEREFLRQARAWPLPKLDTLGGDVLAADIACKQTGAPDHLIAERLLMQICAQARRLGL